MRHREEQTGRVFLVGAGPGAADLITVRGLERLREADVVLYDRLVGAELLEECAPHARLVSVGKSPHPAEPSVPQEEIHDLILLHARAGSTVVRLKGGDPCVFGRGWEEFLVCREAGIPCEFVPGITSALAVPELAGVPVTVRGTARSFAVVTGQTEAGGEPVDWEALSKAETLVILMGISALPEIAKHLMAHRDANTPVAVISPRLPSLSAGSTGHLAEHCRHRHGAGNLLTRGHGGRRRGRPRRKQPRNRPPRRCPHPS